MNWKINLLGWAIIVLACPTWMCAQSQQGITHSGQLTGPNSVSIDFVYRTEKSNTHGFRFMERNKSSTLCMG